MNKVYISNICTHGNLLEVEIKTEGDIGQYIQSRKSLIEYGFDLGSIPKSVLVIPALSNLLPIVWLMGAEVYVDEIDEDFMCHIEQVREGFQEMYPTLSFSGCIVAKSIVSNRDRAVEGRCACFFSGGVDAFATLYAHLEEKPLLMTVWGSDIKLDDETGWGNVLSHVRDTARELNLDYTCIRSNFRSVPNESSLYRAVKKSGDGWWHGFGCGMGLIGHAAVVAYHYQLERVYIASSFPASLKGQYTCGSDPLMDNHIWYAGCRTIHDGYEMDRQQKVKYILDCTKEQKKKPVLRVCWQSSGGKNCCACEKCYRTILEIVSEGGDPNQYGFTWGEDDVRRCEHDFRTKIDLPMSRILWSYNSIIEAFERNYSGEEIQEKYAWLLYGNIEKINDHPMKRFRKSVFYRGWKKIWWILKRK